MLESLFNKIAVLQACNFIKQRLQHRCFPVRFANILRTPILKNIWKRLLLDTGKHKEDVLQNKKTFLKILQYSQENIPIFQLLQYSLHVEVSLLKIDSNTGVFL